MGKMLSMEYLLEEAKSNALPVIKKRAIVREYLQIMALSSIYNRKFGKHFFFMGGTAMRYFYRMPRFSEDLDFNTTGLGYQEFEDILKTVREDISKEGFSVTLSCVKRNNLFTAKLIFYDVIEKYSISDKRGMNLMIKVEINKPNWELITESKVKANNISLPAKDTILSYLKSMDEKELKQLALQVKPFLFKEDDMELILKAPLYGESFLADYV
ncbi:MAG: nucleotidyl transferase AbiEii/AbiGii toxin family protein [Candidatus Omnitrophica bacterium]|nr:nucleotidyl transferase AbiEii/AbiGii toxin family protein [Candidatus Omnitrophota bacterium]